MCVTAEIEEIYKAIIFICGLVERYIKLFSGEFKKYNISEVIL